MITAKLIPYSLHFKVPAGTSRGILHSKPSWFIVLQHKLTGNIGIGECSIIPNLSIDDELGIEQELETLINRINTGELPNIDEYTEWPSIQFGLETALEDLAYEDNFSPYPGDFSNGKTSIPINGLVWMGDESFMKKQVTEKIDAGFNCIKLKIGAIDFKTELAILESIRKAFPPTIIELRVDANGAFTPKEALGKLDLLSKHHIHSIEQPIKQGQWKEMAILTANTPIPIALDEELIGVHDTGQRIQMLDFIRPQFIILKPSLIGGIKASESWVSLAEKSNIGWWATSALESNIGLNAISQWVSNIPTNMPQGLGTGSLFTNNIESPLTVTNGRLTTNNSISWDNSLFE